jgi:hypothetical protein
MCKLSAANSLATSHRWQRLATFGLCSSNDVEGAFVVINFFGKSFEVLLDYEIHANLAKAVVTMQGAEPLQPCKATRSARRGQEEKKFTAL